jgi:hypothetical protein
VRTESVLTALLLRRAIACFVVHGCVHAIAQNDKTIALKEGNYELGLVKLMTHI